MKVHPKLLTGILAICLLGGCANMSNRQIAGTAIGAGAGALVGAAIGDTTGAVVGGVAGGALGYGLTQGK
jgi:osmotically inducible lipoprotein OsmB